MTKIIQRHDTAANWTAANPVLAAGEMGVETDTSKFKFGDGSSAWSELAYATSGSGGVGTQLTSADGETSYSTLALGDNLVVDTGDIAWTNPAMTSNSQNGYVATASNSTGSNGEAIYRAFDKDTTTNDHCWWSDTKPMPQWIMLECPEPVRVTSCMIKNEVYTPVNLRSGYIQGSNDGSTFDTLYTIINRPNTTGYSETYTFTNDKYYKYLRVYCTESHGNGVSIQEIEFKGFVKDPSAVPSLNVNLDELGNEVNTLANSVAGKQDKLTALNNLVIKKELIGQLNLDWNNGSSTLNPIPDTLTFNSGTRYTNYPFYNQYLNDGDIIVKFSFKHNIFRYRSADPTLKYSWANNRGYIEYYIGASENPPGYFNIVMIDSSGVSRKLLSKGCQITDGQILNISFIWRKNTGNWVFEVYNDSGSLLNSANGTSKYDYAGGLTVENTPVLVSSLGNNMGSFTIYPKTFSLSSSDVESTNIYSKSATTSSAGIVQPDGTSITISETGVISGQDVKTFTGYSDTGTLVLKSINGVLQWVAE